MALQHPCTECQPLHLPWTQPEDFMDPQQAAVHHAENYLELMRYNTYFIKNCLCCDCGGGGEG